MAEAVDWKSIKIYLLTRPADVQTPSVPTGLNATEWMLLRKHVNEVYPGILLGDYLIASKPEDLKKFGVTHVVNCAMGSGFNHINTDQQLFAKAGIQFHGIPAEDSMDFKLTPYFEEAVGFIEEALKTEGNKVYVHCVAGISRSATIVIAFLMRKRRMRVMDAVVMVRERRGIKPNDGFVRELAELDKQLFCDQT